MTTRITDTGTGRRPTAPLGHVRWLAGGTGAGKSTVARALAARWNATVYDGDRAEHHWLERCVPERHPYLSVVRGRAPGAMWRDRDPREVFQGMASLHGETIGFVVEDLLAAPSDRLVLVDYFGVLPGDLAPLLSRPEHAVFLLPTPGFRRETLSARYADAGRARANWGTADPAAVLEKRLVRDALWDEEVRRQASLHGLDVITVDGTVPLADLADRLAARLGPDRTPPTTPAG